MGTGKWDELHPGERSVEEHELLPLPWRRWCPHEMCEADRVGATVGDDDDPAWVVCNVPQPWILDVAGDPSAGEQGSSEFVTLSWKSRNDSPPGRPSHHSSGVRFRVDLKISITASSVTPCQSGI